MKKNRLVLLLPFLLTACGDGGDGLPLWKGIVILIIALICLLIA